MSKPLVVPDATSRNGVSEPVRGWLLFIGAAIMAFLLYRPDTNAPFEIIDFSETLPFLTGGDDFGERFTALVDYYLKHGRAAFGLSAGLAAKWSLFEWWTPGWQLTRYAVGMTVVAAAWRLLRLLGSNWLGATVGASLFLVSETCAAGWLRPSVNEPFGTLLLLSASILGCGFQEAAKPRPLAVAIGGLLVLMIMVKETLVAATFFPIAIAVCRGGDGRLRVPTWSDRNSMLVVICCLAIFVASVPVLWAYTHTAAEAYSQQFNRSSVSLSNALFGLVPAVFPFPPFTQPPARLSTTALLLWFLILCAGLQSASASLGKVHIRILIVASVVLILARVLVYLPWPYQYPFYSMPYLLGVGVIASVSLTGLSGHRRIFWLAAVSSLGVCLYSAAGSFSQTSRYVATRKLTNSAVDSLYALTRGRETSTFIATSIERPPQEWAGLGPTLARFGRATSRPLPGGLTVVCDDARALMEKPRQARTILLTLRWQCALGGQPAYSIVTIARRVARPDVLLAADTLIADFFDLPPTPPNNR